MEEEKEETHDATSKKTECNVVDSL